jgi:hypothetical protein
MLIFVYIVVHALKLDYRMHMHMHTDMRATAVHTTSTVQYTHTLRCAVYEPLTLKRRALYRQCCTAECQ